MEVMDEPKIRDEVKTKDLCETAVVGPRDDACQPENNADIRNDDLPIVMRREHYGGWSKVCMPIR